MERWQRTRLAMGLLLAVAVFVLPLWASGQDAPEPLPEETVGEVLSMPPIDPHWVFVPDRLMQHSVLFDGDHGGMLGAIPSPGMLTPKLPLVAKSRGEIYSVDLDYDRGVRGNRIDYVTIYDAATLGVVGEVVIPHQTSASNTSLHHAALLDGDRFLLVFSQFPQTLVTVVDLERRAVAGSVPIAGCAGVYAAGADRFGSLCGDGTAVLARLSEDGSTAELTRSAPFFDVVEDAVVMQGARGAGAEWWFTSFAGEVHRLSFGGDAPVASEPWSFSEPGERDDGWRPGGLQPVAFHAATGTLYVLAHVGGPGSHKDASPEIWVFDASARERTARYEVPNLDAAFLGGLMGIDTESFMGSLLGVVIPGGGAHSIVVSQDDAPLLFARHGSLGAIGVLDARTGEHLRTLEEAGFAGPSLGTP